MIHVKIYQTILNYTAIQQFLTFPAIPHTQQQNIQEQREQEAPQGEDDEDAYDEEQGGEAPDYMEEAGKDGDEEKVEAEECEDVSKEKEEEVVVGVDKSVEQPKDSLSDTLIATAVPSPTPASEQVQPAQPPASATPEPDGTLSVHVCMACLYTVNHSAH